MIIQRTQVYINHGRVIAECPRVFCGNAVKVGHGQATMQCDPAGGGCGLESILVWPADIDELWDVLLLRPVPATRNWFPVGHPLAERAGCPTGQTAADLIQEQRDMESV